jgi:hypothetical protein
MINTAVTAQKSDGQNALGIVPSTMFLPSSSVASLITKFVTAVPHSIIGIEMITQYNKH